MDYSKHVQTHATPQSEPILGSNQVPNSAGGYSWAVDDWKRLDRFLVLGSEGGSYYASERKLTIENAEAVVRCVKTDGIRTVNRIVEISEGGRAPKNDPALFALAIAASMGDVKTRQAAFEALPRVARMSTHLFHFIQFAQGFRGWGRGLRRATAKWYTLKSADDLAYQVAKYRQRDGWTHRDELRLSHPVPPTPIHQDIFKWVVKGELGDAAPQIIRDFDALQKVSASQEAVKIIESNPNITHEMLPDSIKGNADVWRALLPNMPMTALIRNLGRMTSYGIFVPMNEASNIAVNKITSADTLKKARIHPIALLAALKVYEQGHGEKGSLAWSPVPEIVDALDRAFYLAFGNVEPANKRMMLSLDVSGSMSLNNIAGMPGITPRIGAAAMALVTAKTEPRYVVNAFSHTMVPVTITPRQRLDDAMKATDRIPMGDTDCAQPMLHALKEKIEVDTFVIYTDSETWAGQIHPSQAIEQYRRKMGIPSKLVVCAMLANKFTIANPNDSGMLDVVGFDTATPSLITDFAK